MAEQGFGSMEPQKPKVEKEVKIEDLQEKLNNPELNDSDNSKLENNIEGEGEFISDKVKLKNTINAEGTSWSRIYEFSTPIGKVVIEKTEESIGQYDTHSDGIMYIQGVDPISVEGLYYSSDKISEVLVAYGKIGFDNLSDSGSSEYFDLEENKFIKVEKTMNLEERKKVLMKNLHNNPQIS